MTGEEVILSKQFKYLSIIYYRNNGVVESGGAKEKHKGLMHIIAFHAIDKQALVCT